MGPLGEDRDEDRLAAGFVRRSTTIGIPGSDPLCHPANRHSWITAHPEFIRPVLGQKARCSGQDRQTPLQPSIAVTYVTAPRRRSEDDFRSLDMRIGTRRSESGAAT